jgi:recombination protein RecA
MTTRKSKSDDDLFQDLAAATGGEVLDEIETILYYVDTGNLALNFACSGRFMGGGLPGGRLTEIYGPSASSKSLIGTNVLFGCQRIKGVPIILDTENAVNKDFVRRASHCDLAQIVRYTPQTLEKCFAKIYKAVEHIRSKPKYKTAPIVVIFDSISVPPTERELRELDLPDGYTEADFKRIVKQHEQPGERARVCSRELRKLNAIMEKWGVTVVIMNQIRMKIGVMYGNPETTAGGGMALPFYASCRLATRTTKKIEKKLTAKRKKVLGVHVTIKNVKNRTYRPFVQADDVPLYFEAGINPLGGMLTALLDAERIDGKGGNYFVKEPWAGGKDIKFKSSMEKNEVPLSVLLECPALIDAKDAKEIEDYLEPFKNAMTYVPTGDVEETDVAEDDEDTDEEIDRDLA